MTWWVRGMLESSCVKFWMEGRLCVWVYMSTCMCVLMDVNWHSGPVEWPELNDLRTQMSAVSVRVIS